MNNNIPKKSQIVITYGESRWIGLWKHFKQVHPDKEITHVETLYDYTERMKPLNNKR